MVALEGDGAQVVDPTERVDDLGGGGQQRHDLHAPSLAGRCAGDHRAPGAARSVPRPAMNGQGPSYRPGRVTTTSPDNCLRLGRTSRIMALDAQHRSSIYRKLLPLLGEDDANALMTELPVQEGDELATKDLVRAEIADLRTELRTEIGGLRTELHTEIGALRAEMADRITRQTAWIVGVVVAATGVVVGMGSLPS
ncbi:MAG: hypothetical protein U5R31_02180 [Acidimicrobiia bacterium]|nr:hypothetical protein [Acidimicrobiia bacterium]